MSLLRSVRLLLTLLVCVALSSCGTTSGGGQAATGSGLGPSERTGSLWRTPLFDSYGDWSLLAGARTVMALRFSGQQLSVVALDIRTGESLWDRTYTLDATTVQSPFGTIPILGPDDRSAEAPILHLLPDHLIVRTASQVLAIRLDGGTEAWRLPDATGNWGDAGATAAAGSRSRLTASGFFTTGGRASLWVAAGDHTVIVLDPDFGRVLRTDQLPGSILTALPPELPQPLVLARVGRVGLITPNFEGFDLTGSVVAVGEVTRPFARFSGIQAPISNTVLLTDRTALGRVSYTDIGGFDLLSGGLMWQSPIGFGSSFLGTGRGFYELDNRGAIQSLDPATGRFRWRWLPPLVTRLIGWSAASGWLLWAGPGTANVLQEATGYPVLEWMVPPPERIRAATAGPSGAYLLLLDGSRLVVEGLAWPTTPDRR